MIAYLGMYDSPTTTDANDAFWSAIRAHLGYGPTHLTRDWSPWDIWQSPDLLFAQTCGYPLRARLAAHVALVGTPDYGLPGCPPGYYNSVFITRVNGPYSTRDFAGASMAFNDTLSQSGYAAPLLHLGDQGIVPGPLVETGAHAASARAVLEGKADFAAIDALTWLMLRQADPGLTARLKTVATTQPTPGLPYITAPNGDAAEIARAVSSAIMDMSADHRTVLHVRQLVQIPLETYLALPNP